MGIFSKIMGTHSERELKRVYPIVDKIEAMGPAMEKLSDEELRAKTDEFKKRLSEGETLDDLLGKTISIGAEESGTERNANQILQAQGISGDMVKTVNLDYTEAAAKLADGEIDAFFCTAGTQTTVIGELAKECGIRLLSIDVKCRNRLKAAYPFYSEYTIPAGTYTGQTEEVKTLSVQAVLLAGDSLSENTVKELTELLFLHGKDIRYAASIELKEDEQSAIGGITIPFHKGAAAYYAECGIEVPTE